MYYTPVSRTVWEMLILSGLRVYETIDGILDRFQQVGLTYLNSLVSRVLKPRFIFSIFKLRINLVFVYTVHDI